MSTNISGLLVLARLGRQPIGMGQIFSQLSAEKQVGGGGMYYARPSLSILINYKQEGVRIRVNKKSYAIQVDAVRSYTFTRPVSSSISITG
jgi:hypothetical protein